MRTTCLKTGKWSLAVLTAAVMASLLLCGRRTAALSVRSLIGGESSCETLPSTIHISKEVTDEHGQLVRTCEGDLAVNKCEGTCSSQLQPSVARASGFLKECQCCRETHLREREVLLQQCYDKEGQPLAGEQGHLAIRLKEPAMCKCYRCGQE